ncbi:MAG: hypothetical protein ABIF10_04370 [Candidatus Woesearchaeota archaeon]
MRWRARQNKTAKACASCIDEYKTAVLDVLVGKAPNYTGYVAAVEAFVKVVELDAKGAPTGLAAHLYGYALQLRNYQHEVAQQSEQEIYCRRVIELNNTARSSLSYLVKSASSLAGAMSHLSPVPMPETVSILIHAQGEGFESVKIRLNALNAELDNQLETARVAQSRLEKDVMDYLRP